MKGVEKISEVSSCLQRLIDPTVFSEVQKAVEKKDENAFIEACKKVKIPKIQIADLWVVLSTPGPFAWP